MIIRAPFTRNKTAEGVNQTHENGNLFYTVHAAANYIHYLIKPKGEDNELISPETRVKHLYSSLSIPMPEMYLGKENYNEISKEISIDIATKLKAEHDKRLELYISHGNKVNGEIPFLQEFIFGFANSEVESFKTEKNIADFMIEVGKDFAERYTDFDMDIHGGFLKPHIKKNKENTSELLPDMHLLTHTIDINGRLLPLDPKQVNKKIGDIHFAMENDPKYPTLLKIRTEAWNRNGKTEKLSVKEDLAEKINEVFEAGKFDVEYIKTHLKDYGITIIPEHKGNQLNSYTIRYLGKVFTQDGIADIKGMKTKIFNYLKLDDFKKSTPNFTNEHFNKLSDILEKGKGKPIEDLQQDLMKYGIALVPNVNKKKEISGYSFNFTSLNKSLQGSVLNFRATDYVVNTMSGDKLFKAANVYLTSKEKAENAADFVSPVESFTEDGVTYVRDMFGNFKPVIREKKKFIYVHWSATGEEDILSFILRMKANNQYSPLLKLLPSDGNKNLFISSYNSRRSIEIINTDRIRVYQPKNKFVVESAIDAYLATHQLTDKEREEGCVLTIRIETKKQDYYDLMWLEARKKGIYVVNGKPSPEVEKKFEALCKDKAKLYRSQNKKRLLTLKRNVDSKKSYRTLRLTNYKRLGNDVDRQSYAYAFVDAFLMDLDTRYVLNPPQKKVAAGARMRLDEISQFRELMIETVKQEAPEKLNAFYAELAKYDVSGTPTQEVKEVQNLKLKEKTEQEIEAKKQLEKRQLENMASMNNSVSSKVESSNEVKNELKFKKPKA